MYDDVNAWWCRWNARANIDYGKQMHMHLAWLGPMHEKFIITCMQCNNLRAYDAWMMRNDLKKYILHEQCYAWDVYVEYEKNA